MERSARLRAHPPSAALASGAEAETVTVGSPLTATFERVQMCVPLCTDVNTKLSETGALMASPFDGTIVRWRVAAAQGAFRLRVMRPDGTGHYVPVASSGAGTVLGTGIETFPAGIAIQAGDLIGLDDETTAAEIGFASTGVTGSQYTAFFPQIAEGVDSSTSVHVFPEEDEEVAFNADVESLPVAGPPAPSTTPISTQIPASTPAPVPIPRDLHRPEAQGQEPEGLEIEDQGRGLHGGKVTKKKGAKASTGKVVGQSRKPGTVLPAGTVVKVTLGKG